MSNTIQNHFEPIAITGISCLFPKATGTGAFWANIKNGVDCITEIPETHWKLDDYFDPDPATPDHTHARTGGFLDPVPFNPLEFGIAPNALEATDTSQLLTLLTTRKALNDAGYLNDKDLDRDRVSVILGVTGAQELVIPLGARLYHPIFRKTLEESGISSSDAHEIVKRINHKFVGWQEGSFPGLLGNVVAGRIANRFDFGGSNCVVDAACAGSLSAIHMACMELQSKRSDMVITGGVDTFNDIFMYMCFSKTKALSPTGHARPFDRGGDGTIIGEGVGVITLKRLEEAEAAGEKIYAVIRGLGASSDGKGNAIYAPSANGQKKALRRTYESAGITPDTIDLVEAHGTGTPVGDAIELQALTDIYREAKPDGRWCALGSVKSQIGHGKAAAGIAGLIKAALAIHHKVLPPTIKVDAPLEPLAEKKTPFYINTTSRPWVKENETPRRAAISAFGFGGSNYHALLEEYKSTVPPVADWDGSVQLLAFSAKNADDLISNLTKWEAPAQWTDFREEAQSLRKAFDWQQTCRLLAVVQKGDDPKAVINRAVDRLKIENNSSWEIPTGIYYGYGDKPGKLALVFSGQGTQYPNMLQDLVCQFPETLDVLNNANTGFQTHSYGSPDNRLSDVIYPPGAFTDEEMTDQVDQLKLTQHAQPGIGAVSIAGWMILKNRFGMAPDAAAGHSYGEICALHAAEAITEEEFHTLSSLRGKLMSAGDTDRGGMAAVTVPLTDIQSVLDEEKLELVIANKNAPEQGVISGKTEEIQRALTIFKERGMRIIPLKVSAAFHSPLVADATRPFGEHLETFTFQKPVFPVYSNTTAEQYPKQQKQVRKILAAQLENPVEFVDEIRKMHSDGIRTFVEVGPGRRMTGLVKAILSDQSFEAVALDQSNGKKPGQEDLARLLGKVASLGYRLNLEAWDDTFVAPVNENGKKAAMSVMIRGANYVRPKEALPPHVITQHQGPVTKTGFQSSLPGDTPSVTQAFNAIQENLTGLQRLQEQTAILHQQFLQSQQEAQQAFQGLINQQQSVLLGQQPTVPTSQPHIPPTLPILTLPQTQPLQPTPHGVTSPAATQVPTQPAPAKVAPEQTLTPILLNVVSEKTGYPTDLLEPEMELDADLGIDSIKRVEILSALQEKLPQLPTVNPDQMAGIRKLSDIVSLMAEHAAVQPMTRQTATSPLASTLSIATSSPVPAGATAVPASPSIAPGKTISAAGVSKSLLMDVVSEKTGYPVDLLEPDMELDADLGIDSIKRVEILSALQEKIPGMPAVSPEKMGSIRTLKDILVTLTMLESDVSKPVTPVTQPRKKGIFDTQPIGVKGISSTGSEEDVILGIIAEKTGYPTDLLEPEMELDADLGIDSIKRVEILSSLQQEFTDLPDVQPDQMAELRTVKDIIGVVGKVRAVRTGRAKTGPIQPRQEESKAQTPKAPKPVDRPVRSEESAVVSEPVPAPKPQPVPPPKPQEAPKPAISKPEPVKVVPVEPVIERSEPEKTTVKESIAKESPKPLTRVHRGILQTMGVQANRKRVNYPDHAEIWITRDDCGLSESIFEEFENQYIPCRLVSPDYLEFVELPDRIAGLIIVGPRDACSMKTLNKTFELLKLVGPKIRNSDEDATEHPLIVSIIRLDGMFGLSDRTVDFQPMTAALSGMVKTIKAEWPETACKVIDVDADRKFEPNMKDLMEELFLDGPLELGMSARGKVTLTLVDAPQDPSRMTGEPLIPGNWVMVSGGARGVTAACAKELARRFSVNLLLLGRSEPPKPEPEWLRHLETEAEIKKAIMTQAKTKLTPKELNGLFEYRMKNREILRNMDEMMLQGVQVRYESVDVNDAPALQALFHQIKQEGIVIEGLVHGAGILADKLIEEKDVESFDKVIRTKVESLRHISDNIDLERLKILVLFSSSTARFGRKGQLDYGMANEVLNKFAQKFSRLFPNCITLSMNWGPWDGGMVTPELKKLFKSEGIETIDLSSGARFLTRELRLEYGRTVHRPIELILLGSQEPDQVRPGDLEPIWDEGQFDEESPHDEDEFVDDDEDDLADGAPDTVYLLELNEATFPVLRSHLINGLPVVPMALFMELAAQGAKMSHPNLYIYSLENFRLLKGIILRPKTSVTLECCVSKAVREDRYFRVTVELKGTHADGKKFVHVSTDVILAPRLPEAPEAPEPLTNPEPYPIHQGQLYSEVLFHGELLQSIRAVEGVNETGITAALDGVPDAKEWMMEPVGDNWLTDPLAIDGSFQLMILWTELMLEMPSLPCGLAAYRQYTTEMPAWSVADIRIRDTRGNQVFADVFFKNDEGKVIATIEAYECITDAALRDAFKTSRDNS